MRSISAITVVLLACSASLAHADIIQPSNYCRKPIKPYAFNSEWDVSRFKNEVDAYESCIDAFVRQQEQAIARHKQAANAAIDEWNNYVNNELR